MSDFTRQDLLTRYEVFDKYALKDQRAYYKSRSAEYRQANRQVTRYRALFSFGTSVVTAMAGLIISLNRGQPLGSGLLVFVSVLAILSIVLPAIGSFFSMLADLYQWEKFSTVFESAIENLEVSDAQLSNPERIVDDEYLKGAYLAYVTSALDVMQSETAQWGQARQSPPEIEAFIEAQRQKELRLNTRGIGGTGRGPTT
jgi:hypothetical protein